MAEDRGLLTVAAIRALERAAITELQLSGTALMSRAANAAFDLLASHWPDKRRLAVVCGRGNNGGDGLLVACAAHAAGYEVSIYAPQALDGGTEESAYALGQAQARGLSVQRLPADHIDADLIVDALFGIGLNRVVAGDSALAIACMNNSPCARLALDIPSGVLADSGAVPGTAVKADVTITFLADKLGLATGAGRRHAGLVAVDNLGLPEPLLAAQVPGARRQSYTGIAGCLPMRQRDAHKGDFGHVLVIGGAPGFAGAARLAAEAAARCGAGLVSLATHPQHAATVTLARPEIMTHAVETEADLKPLMKRATVIAIGPGLGQDAWGRQLLSVANTSRLPKVVDADALNLLKDHPHPHGERVLTPHPGEAARLLGISNAEIQADRYGAARAIAERYASVVILKGAGTVVDDGLSAPLVIDEGNPGMASGGMGDVLTGVVAALIAQGWSLPEAASYGATVHAFAADCAAREDGERGLLAADLAPHLRRAMNPNRPAS